MATITTITYNTVATAFTITSAATLASSLVAGASSLAVANQASRNWVDAQVTASPVMAAGTPYGPLWLGIGVSTDNTNFGQPYLGTDAAISLVRPPQFPTNFTPGPGGALYFPGSMIFYAAMLDLVGWATTLTPRISIPSVAACIGSPNVLPMQWGIFILNQSGFAFTACAASYSGVTYTNT
jgi:hypothetical protein